MNRVGELLNGQRKRWKVSEAEMKEYIIKVDVSKPDIMGGMPLMEPAKELIRCINCKYWRKLLLNRNGYGACHADNPIRVSNQNWFCADGKRRDNDG